MFSADKAIVSIRLPQEMARRTLLHSRMLPRGFAFRTARSALDDFFAACTMHCFTPAWAIYDHIHPVHGSGSVDPLPSPLAPVQMGLPGYKSRFLMRAYLQFPGVIDQV